MSKLCVLIDPGHGVETKGKRSPDGRLFEWKWNREMADMIKNRLLDLGISATVLVTEEKDVSLGNRVLRANTIAKNMKGLGYDCIYVSIHVNAANSDGQWHEARGLTNWIYTQASSKAKALGKIYSTNSHILGMDGNRWIPAIGYFTANYYVLKNTNMPAILVEHFFQDNKQDVDYLLSEQGKKECLNLHEVSILEYIRKYKYDLN